MKHTTPHATNARRLLTGGILSALVLTGLSVPAQAADLGRSSTQSASECSSFTRAKVLKKREILNRVTSGELRNSTGVEQELFIERSVSDTRTTSEEYRGDWTIFKDVLTVGVSNTVTEEHTISGLQRHAMKVAPRRTFLGIAYARTWQVDTEVTKRDSNCNYSTQQITGEVATTDDLVWTTEDIGPA